MTAPSKLYNMFEYMDDHAVAPACRSNPVLGPEERIWCLFSVRPKKIILTKRRGNSIKHKLLEMIRVTVHHTDYFCLKKTKKGTKTTPGAPKLSYFDRQAPQLSDQNNHGTPARIARFILRERAISNLKKSHLPRIRNQNEPKKSCFLTV